VGAPAQGGRAVRHGELYTVRLTDTPVTAWLGLGNDPLLADQIGKAAFDAVGPLLLIGWSESGLTCRVNNPAGQYAWDRGVICWSMMSRSWRRPAMPSLG
jgi:hypothetical protein